MFMKERSIILKSFSLKLSVLFCTLSISLFPGLFLASLISFTELMSSPMLFLVLYPGDWISELAAFLFFSIIISTSTIHFIDLFYSFDNNFCDFKIDTGKFANFRWFIFIVLTDKFSNAFRIFWSSAFIYIFWFRRKKPLFLNPF